MATYIKGDAIANATSYEIFEKKDGSSIPTYLDKAAEINFKLESLGILDEGNHTFVVKAKAEGYEESDYSNEVTVNIPLIYSFNIMSAGSFNCMPGMTFAEWCDSKYNTAGFHYNENGVVYYGTTGKSIKEAGADNAIVQAADYTLISAGGGV